MGVFEWIRSIVVGLRACLTVRFGSSIPCIFRSDWLRRDIDGKVESPTNRGTVLHLPGGIAPSRVKCILRSRLTEDGLAR